MRTQLFHVASVVLLSLPLALNAGAQTSSAAKDAQKPQETVTIVGCLVHGNPADTASGRKSDAGAANANDYFVRTPAVAVPVGGTVSVGGAGTPTAGRATTSAGQPSATTLYRITGLNRDQLQPHVGHRVELQGRLSGNPEGNTKAKTTVDASGRATTTVEQRLDVAGVLQATSVKMVDAKCQ